SIKKSLLILGAWLFLTAIGAGHAVLAAPTEVTIQPYLGARFVPGQKFDVRVEGKGTGPFSATLTIDGVPHKFTSGAQNTMTTDDITSAGYGGFNLRGYSNHRVGFHTITATFTDSTGSVTVTSKFEVVDVFPGHDHHDERQDSHSSK